MIYPSKHPLMQKPYGESFHMHLPGSISTLSLMNACVVAMTSTFQSYTSAVANLYMTVPTRPRLWKRYADDTSSGRTQPRNSLTISTWSGRPSSSLWSRKKTGHSLSSTHYSGEEMAAWMSLSPGSPCIRTDISISSPIIRPTW